MTTSKDLLLFCFAFNEKKKTHYSEMSRTVHIRALAFTVVAESNAQSLLGISKRKVEDTTWL